MTDIAFREGIFREFLLPIVKHLNPYGVDTGLGAVEVGIGNRQMIAQSQLFGTIVEERILIQETISM